MKRKMFIDCDPGVDDLIAVLAALRLPDWDIVGAASVAGNVPLRKTTANLGSILTLAGREDIPYAQGADKPLVRTPVTAEDVHGDSGLGQSKLPAAARQPADISAAALLYKCAQEHKGELTVLAIGPLTNLARAFTAYPQLPAMLKDIVIMGGGHAHGNITPKAEFNIYADPHAAHVVFECGTTVTMVGLDATMAMGLEGAACDSICADTETGRIATTALADIRRYSVGYGLGDVAYVHDLCALLCATQPELFELQSCRVDIELKSSLAFGQTVCDITGVSNKPINARVAMGVHGREYYEALCNTLAEL